MKLSRASWSVLEPAFMNIFDLRSSVIDDHERYFDAFLEIRDERISDLVDAKIASGRLWPDPLIQLNPLFEPGDSIDELGDDGVLHDECRRIFTKKSADTEGAGEPIRLYRHQSEAVRFASAGRNYVLTTGTGSGKSLTYIIPIVDHVLREGSGKGIRAIVVYPMNALANSQMEELTKFLSFGYPEGEEPVTFRRYTGQDEHEEREQIKASPPDILLTNYVMLELLLTRVDDKTLIDNAKDLQFLVLDELHTYRGRQGADVAMLLRRTRLRTGGSSIQFVGTSATLASGGDQSEERAAVARVAEQIFGSEVRADHVIGETLLRTTVEREVGADKLRERVVNPTPPTDFQMFVSDPLSSWIESTFGIATREDRLVRADPRSITGGNGAAALLADTTGTSPADAADAIKKWLLAGYEAVDPETRRPAFAFRLHQFVSGGDTVFGSLDTPGDRDLTLNKQPTVPGTDHVYFPLAFCRECGHEYYLVALQEDAGGVRRFTPRSLSDQMKDSDDLAGFLYYSGESPWPTDPDEVMEALPEDAIELVSRKEGLVRRIKRSWQDYLPRSIAVAPDGQERSAGLNTSFIPAPFRFCLYCGISYIHFIRNDFSKLGTLGSEGRASATTTLGVATLHGLDRMNQEVAPNDRLPRKLLSFTDNRQDASLQAGHFNDFVEVAMLRSALFRALSDQEPTGLRHEDLTSRVLEAMGLEFAQFARNPEARYRAYRETVEALNAVIGYRLYRDLQRGWRVTMPNLEQVGLLEFDYLSLRELCQEEQDWAGTHEILAGSGPDTREWLARILLGHMRQELGIRVGYLDPDDHERLRQLSKQRLRQPWALDEDEDLEVSRVVFPRSRGPYESSKHIYLSGRSAFGLLLGRHPRIRQLGGRIRMEDRERIIEDLLATLAKADLVDRVSRSDLGPEEGYQLPAAALIWKPGDGTSPVRDPLRVTRLPDEPASVNPFFLDLYRSAALTTERFESREHTAQIEYERRLEREHRFRGGDLPVLFCSPTMELGVDIADLNIVNMRNVPPTPANYAQRSGRAGRSGQPAFVYTYCSSQSSHDQHFFRRPERMVSGKVSPPRLDLSNEDLIRSHVHAIWLAEADLNLGASIIEILDVDASEGEEPTLDLYDFVAEALRDDVVLARTRRAAEDLLATIEGEAGVEDWLSDHWLDDSLNSLPRRFEEALGRWREMYRAARLQAVDSGEKLLRPGLTPREEATARRLRAEAESQLHLLRQSGSAFHSDFYSYRYLATEGFLPGYNFPRLPLTAYIPARRGAPRDDHLSRPRFLAISEFGPRAVIYHEGSQYEIERVSLPVGESEVALSTVKLCDACGYLHSIPGEGGPDLCERCGEPLGVALPNLFRLRNVYTRRRTKINSDEEQRVRMGYDLRTAIRFPERDGRLYVRSAAASDGDRTLLQMSYGPTTTIWRVNMGWARHRQGEFGFHLDLTTGKWTRRRREEEDDEELGRNVQRVIPFVQDRRNTLLIDPVGLDLDRIQTFSLLYALKKAVQIHYQLEDNELAVVPLPDRETPNLVLLYEAAEGGAGVLRQLVEDPLALRHVSRTALEICHFDPMTGEDREHAPGTEEVCGQACYDCLLDYANQWFHSDLDRHAIKDLLLGLADADVRTAPEASTRSEHLEHLRKQASANDASGLELKWLEFIADRGLRLPSHAQIELDGLYVQPDFFYEREGVAVFIDGPPHKSEGMQSKDRTVDIKLRDASYTPLRFRAWDGDHPGLLDEWSEVVEEYRELFGHGDAA